MNPAYRADIDGLRGVAVLSVLLFHVGVNGFGGGYVGVDVFFVISGYLIGGILLTELGSGTFSLARFYERRIRRIFPALFFMLGLGCLAAAFLLIPRDLMTFAQSVIAVTTFVSNVWFWRQTGGYFQTPPGQQVLLHTWSLAVEEQFYIAFPLLLMAVQRVGRSRFALFMGLVAAASLVLSVSRLNASPQAVFFLAPTRAWEFVMGAILACGVLPVLRRPGLRNILAAAGLGAIVFSVVAYDATTVFPGLAALPPTLGAALIIHAGAAGTTIAGSLLATRPLL